MMQQYKKEILLFLTLILFFSLGTFLFLSVQKNKVVKNPIVNTIDQEVEKMMISTPITEDKMKKNLDSKSLLTINEIKKESKTDSSFQYQGQLKDILDGQSSGFVEALFKDNSYMMVATFSNLPVLNGTDFYEGWLVRKGEDFDVISTGKVEVIDGQHQNLYSSGTDLTDHLFYVLTIEPDDGNPAPDKHILEGTLKKLGE